MNLILHQFKTDVAHFRAWLLGYWAWIGLEGVTMVAGAGSAGDQMVALTIAMVGQLFCGVLLVAALVQADPLVGTSAAWLTRPMRRPHLFWAKSSFIVLLVLFPKIAVESVAWVAHGYSLHLWLCAAGQSLLFAGIAALGAAAVAALTGNLARFFLGVGLLTLMIFISVVSAEMLVTSEMIKRATDTWYEGKSFSASTDTVVSLVCVAGALAAWIAQGRFRLPAVGGVCLIVGIMAAPMIDTVWHYDFLKPHPLPAPALTASAWPAPPNAPLPAQQISQELAVDGLAPGQVAVLQDNQITLQFEGAGKTLSSLNYLPGDGSWWPAESHQSGAYYHAIENLFPPGTLCFNDNGIDSDWSVFADSVNKGVINELNGHAPPGILSGKITLTVFTPRKVADVPLRSARFNTFPGQWVTVRGVRLIGGVMKVSVTESMAHLMWDSDMQTADFVAHLNRGRLGCTYALYHPATGEVMIPSQGQTVEAFDTPWTGEERISMTLRFSYPALRERLEGVTAAQWMREARLCVFAPIYEGTKKCSIHQAGYQWTVPNEFK